MHIAIIDDDPDIAHLLAELCEDEGWEAQVCLCPEGVDALMQGQTPSAIILDLWLGKPATGWDVLLRLKQDPATRLIPVVLCTGGVDHVEGKLAWLAEQGIPVVTKPFDLQEIVRAVTSAISQALPHGISNATSVA